MGKEEFFASTVYYPPVPEKPGNMAMEARFASLQELNELYLPTEMSLQIYYKLYSAMQRSMEKKANTVLCNQQRANNYKSMQGAGLSGIIGGVDSFSVIGPSGIGKSNAIAKAVQAMGGDAVMENVHPFQKILPCLNVQCPHDCSVKGLLIEILRQLDQRLLSNNYQHVVRKSLSVDVLIGMVCQACLNHVGLLIIDEIQNVCLSHQGMRLMAALTQIINSSGISICMVGTPEVRPFFESRMQLARRTIGLNFKPLANDDSFSNFCRELWRYQYTRKRMPFTDNLISWLYTHTGGLLSLLLILWHDAQEAAILNDRESIDMPLLNRVYKERLSSFLPFFGQKNRSSSNPKQKNPASMLEKKEATSYISVANILMEAKKQKANPVAELIRNGITVEVIKC